MSSTEPNFVVHCRKCGKFDVDVMMCSATDVRCAGMRPGRKQHWVRGRINDTFQLVDVSEWDDMSEVEQDQVNLHLMEREMGRRDYEPT